MFWMMRPKPASSKRHAPKVVMLDFDGLSLSPTAFKDDAFRHTFSEYPKELEAIMAYHHGIAGLIRFKKFKYIVEQFWAVFYTPELEARLAKRFSGYVLKGSRLSICAWGGRFLKTFLRPGAVVSGFHQSAERFGLDA